MPHVQLAIEGMTCAHCVSAVDRALRAVPGVTTMQVRLGEATLALDPDAAPVDGTVAAALEAVRDVGYEAHVKP